MIQPKDYMKYMYVILFVFIIYLAYLIVRPFMTALLTGAILAYIFFPFYEAVRKRLKSESGSAMIVAVLIIMLLAVPFLFMMGTMAKESQFVYIKTKQMFITGDIFHIGCAPETAGFGCRLSNWIGSIIGRPNVRYHIEDSIGKITTAVTSRASAFVFSIPAILLNVFITFFTTFYLFKDGRSLVERIRRMLPLKLHHQKKVFQQLDETTYAIIYGSLLVAAIQGLIGAVGYFIFGVPSPIVWGILTAIFALLPFIGTAIVWVPISGFIIVQGASTNSPSLVLQGVGLLLYGAIIIASVDNILKPYIIGKRGKIHPILVLIGVLGGLTMFGFIGFIIGPLILAIFANFIEIYEKERIIEDGKKKK